MGKSKSAEKRVRQNEKKQMRNTIVKTRVKTVSKRLLKEVGDGNTDAAKARLKEAIVLIDKATSKGVIHKNTAARKKSRLSKKVNALTSEEPAA